MISKQNNLLLNETLHCKPTGSQDLSKLTENLIIHSRLPTPAGKGFSNIFLDVENSRFHD